MTQASNAKIPVTIVTGFLGSGKTTLLRHILGNAEGRRIAVIVNEFGELGIDGEILRGCGIGCDDEGNEREGALYELANGCVCCTVQEEFLPVMLQLAERRGHIDAVIIETSGLALPKPLVQAFQWPGIANIFTVDSVVTVVDGPAAASGQFAENPEAVDEAAPRRPQPRPRIAAARAVRRPALGRRPGGAQQDRPDGRRRASEGRGAGARRAAARGQDRGCHRRRGCRSRCCWARAARPRTTIHLRESHHDHEEDHDHDEFDSLVIELPPVDRDGLLAVLGRAGRTAHDLPREGLRRTAGQADAPAGAGRGPPLRPSLRPPLARRRGAAHAARVHRRRPRRRWRCARRWKR